MPFLKNTHTHKQSCEISYTSCLDHSTMTDQPVSAQSDALIRLIETESKFIFHIYE